jgi:hypothetical protein
VAEALPEAASFGLPAGQRRATEFRLLAAVFWLPVARQVATA